MRGSAVVAKAADAASVLAYLHAEPPNALSLPTWLVHTSSVWEWVVAIRLVLAYARITRQKVYFRLAYGMLPLHASSLCAVTYHFFYNDPSLNYLVTLQAALTFFGNTTLLAAAYGIYKTFAEAEATDEVGAVGGLSSPAIEPSEDEVSAVFARRGVELESTRDFCVKTFAVCFVSAVFVKYGSLLFSLPFNPEGSAAATIIVAPTVLLSLDLLRRDKLEEF